MVIGGSTNDWYTPVDGKAVGGVSYLNSFPWDTDTPNFAFAADFQFPEDIAEVISHETGHSLGLVHDSQFRFYKDVGADPPETVRLFVEYYAGHGSGDTAWAPIMGVGYGKNITQWSKGEYFNATNDKDGANPLQDDLAVITSGNGFDYRTDDHGDTTATASPVVQDPLTADSDTSLFEGEGIIERNTDIDFFSFTVEGLGELVSLDIQPFYNGPNLDVLAKLYDSSGAVIATSDSIDELGATFVDQALLPGTYYVSVEGGSRPITFIDPTFHPDLFEAEGNPPDPALPPDLSDWGYSNYGSLGYYSIAGTRKKSLVVGVDFDIDGGASPTNWNQYTGGTTPETLTDLISELGETVPFTLSINSTGNMIDGVGSANPIDGTDLPNHGLPLDELGGYVSTTDDTLTFTWGNLVPNSVYQIYVFGHADINAENSVIVDGGQWNGVQQSYSFTQVVSPEGLVVNNNAPGNDDLSTYSLLVISDGNGEITITAAGAEGLPLAIAGLAISPTKVGSISGQKWDDANGNRANDSGEAGLPDWVIYLDLNNDGQLNSSSGQDVTVPAPEVPQDLLDNATFKNELTFDEPGEILDLNVSLDITHTYDADLRVYLVSPSGTKVKLFANIGGANDNFTNTTLDDEAAISITSGLAPYTGSFRPQESLSAFDGEDAAGIWTLEVQDDANGDTGMLNSWSITVNTAPVFLEPYAVTDASGNYTFTDLPAGQYYVREHFLDQQTQDGWKQTLAPAPVTVRSGADVTDVDFGNWIPVAQEGSIQGQKFSDLNGDGVKDANEPGLGDWIVYIDANHNGERDIANSPTTIAATDLPKAITDFHTINSQVTFDGLGTVFSVEVTLDITHSFVGDLNAYLIGPSGRQVELFTEVGGQYNDLHNITLDDSAARSIATLGIDDLPYSGTWQPEGHLSDFIGEDAAGLWTLQISDTAFADQGTLNSWSLKITSGEVYRTTDDDGNYSFDALPPGDYVVREESKSGWVQIPPAVTQLPAGAAVPAAEWSGSQWNVTIAGVDDPNDPDGPDSHRNIKNVDFGNQAVQALPGDFDRSGVVDMRDYVLWRKTLGTSVSNPYDGADGDGNSMVEQADYTICAATTVTSQITKPTMRR